MADGKPAQGTAQDGSMEEILQSIRKIIDEGDDPAAGAAPAQPEPAGPGGSDVLELTEMVEETPAPAEPPPAMDVLANIDSAIAQAKPEPAPASTPPALKEAAMEPEFTPDDEDPLASDDTANATKAAFSKLAKTRSQRPRVGGPRFRSGTTLEDLVIETLKPLVKEWLDTNLPTIVEDMVEREIQRIAR